MPVSKIHYGLLQFYAKVMQALIVEYRYINAYYINAY